MADTRDLTEEWMKARRRVERLTAELREAEGLARATATALGKHMNPGDMAEGEELTCWVWVGHKQERLLVVKKDGHSYRLRWRGEPRPSEPMPAEVA